MIEQYATRVHQIIWDYRIDDGLRISIGDIIRWAMQFGNDARFVLEELSHILPKVYISRNRAKQFISAHIKNLMFKYGYISIAEFLSDTEFLRIQEQGKSQYAILQLLEEVLAESWQTSTLKFDTYPKKNYAYFDDVLATGSTLGGQIVDWLNSSIDGIKCVDLVLTNRIRLSINLFCQHTWGQAFQKYRFNKAFVDTLGQKLTWMNNTEIYNHAKFTNQAHNHAFPVKDQPSNVKSYLANLSANKYESYAYRDETQPQTEEFFSTKENRIRYENVILQKGIDIINQIKGKPKPNIRPLGLINPTYKTFGLGTHFVTWRNIPNNCPLVYWWEVPGHDWVPLFPRKI